MSDNFGDSFRKPIEEFFGGARCFLLSKGRVGLYAGLRAMNLPRGSTVLMPGYTCMVVPSAVRFAGLEPAYLDIDPDTYNMDPGLLEQVSADNLSAVMVQHTYGIPCNMAAMQVWADAHAIPLIEDCCHTFGSRSEGRLCGTLGRFAFMSGQWNKPFSTGLGGILLVNDAQLANKVGRIIDKEASRAGFLRNLMLLFQILAYDTLVTPRTAMRLTRLYRMLGKLGLVIGSSTQTELEGVMPEGYLSGMAACQVRKGVREIARIEQNMQHRKQMTAFYHCRLPEIGFAPVGVSSVDALPMLRYPVRVANKREVVDAAEKAGVEIGSWFDVPLHPAGTSMERFGYRAGMCPEAERAAEQTVNLPTHLKVDEATAEKTLTFLQQRARPV